MIHTSEHILTAGDVGGWLFGLVEQIREVGRWLFGLVKRQRGGGWVVTKHPPDHPAVHHTLSSIIA